MILCHTFYGRQQPKKAANGAYVSKQVAVAGAEEASSLGFWGFSLCGLGFVHFSVCFCAWFYGFGFQIGCWTLGFAFWVLHFGFCILGFVFWDLYLGFVFKGCHLSLYLGFRVYT